MEAAKQAKQSGAAGNGKAQERRHKRRQIRGLKAAKV